MQKGAWQGIADIRNGHSISDAWHREME
jgi:hypothetical protein